MKRLVSACTIGLVVLGTSLCGMPVHALFGGGLKGPLPVYSVDKTVDAATIATQINTLKQLDAALKNLQTMSPEVAAANVNLIQKYLQDLLTMQRNMEGMVMNYSDFQKTWDSQYHDFSEYSGMTGEEYAQNAENLLKALNQSVYNSMQAQGLVAQHYDTASALQGLIQASQSAEGALAAAQVANQIAALQLQQMMNFQQIVAQSNRAQSEWLAYQAHKEKMRQEATKQFFTVKTGE